MDYVALGRTGLKVSPLCLGTMNFGPHTTEPDSFALMARALELGLNCWDTANVYGWVQYEGLTEQIIGRWLAQGGRRREQIVLATKVHGRMGPGPNDRRLSAYQIMRACDESLRRLQTDHLDLYQMHHIDRETPFDEIWQAFEVLVQQGKVLYVGSSNFAGWHLAQAQAAAASRHFLGLVSEQCLYNLTKRTVELEILPAARAYGIGVIPYSPLAGGLLGGALQKQKVGRRASEGQQKEIKKYKKQLQAYEGLCADLGEKPADVALAWLLAQKGITAPIIGPRTMQQYEDSLRAVEIQLSNETLTKLNEIWPGPGGEAPEAYAW